jgi:hypothetical protein
MIRQVVSIDALLPIIREKISLGEEAVLKVKGTSMAPFFVTDLTNVVLVAPKDLKRLDVVLFETEKGTYVLHRIIKSVEDHYLIEGDGLKHIDIVQKDQIIAKVSAFDTRGVTTNATDSRYLWKVKWWVGLRFFRRYLLWLFRHLGKGRLQHE